MSEMKKITNTENVAVNLEYLKEISGLSGNKLSLSMGFPKPTFSSYITGKTVPTVERMVIIRKHFGVRTILDFNMEPESFKKRYKPEKVMMVVDIWKDDLEVKTND